MFNIGIFILICCVATHTEANMKNIGIKISHATFLKRIDNAILYQSSLPLVFKSPMPKIHLEGAINSHVKCTSDETASFCKASQIIQELDSAALSQQQAISGEIKLHMFYKDNGTHTVARRNIMDPLRTFIGEVASWCCGIPSMRMFKSLFARQENIDEAMISIKQSVHKQHRDYTRISDEFNTLASTMNNNFKGFEDDLVRFKRHFEDVTSEYSLWHQFLIKVITQLYVRNFENSRHLKRQSIIDDCRSNLIPSAIIHQDALMLELEIINSKLLIKGWTLAIPLEHITHYFAQKISECMISDDEILIKIKVPIREIHPDFELYSFRSVPQKYESSTCELNLHETYLAVAIDQSVIVPIMGEALRNCEVNDKHGINMCLLAKRPHQMALDSTCPELIYRGAPTQQLLGACSYKCFPSDMPIITSLSYDTFVLTHPSENVSFNCAGNITELKNDYYNKAGSLEIKLPCTCKLIMDGKVVIPEEFPCNHEEDEYVGAYHVLPVLWSNVPSLHVNIHKQHLNSILFTDFNTSYQGCRARFSFG